MADLTLRKNLNRPLTIDEVDDNFQIINSNFFITNADPTTSDDSSKNFKVGCIWTNTSTNKKYECKDDTKGSANWEEASFGGDFVKITENDNTGYATTYREKNPDYYGDIGDSAIDLSYSDNASNSFGATGYCSLAAGYKTTASGYYSLAAGYKTTASGEGSLAAGGETTSKGMCSIAIGYKTIAENDCEFAKGVSFSDKKAFSTSLSFSNKTTDDTQIKLDVYTPVTTNGAVTLEYFTYRLFASQDDKSNKWIRTGSFLVDRTDSTCTISNEDGTDIIKDDADWKLDFVANNANFDIEVTGKANTTIIWQISLEKNIIYF